MARPNRLKKISKYPALKKIKDPKYRMEWLLHNTRRKVLSYGDQGVTRACHGPYAGKRGTRPVVNRLSREYSEMRQKWFEEGKTGEQIGGLIRAWCMERVKIARYRKILPLRNKGYTWKTIGYILARREQRKRPYHEITMARTWEWYLVHEDRLRREGKIK